MQSLSFQNVKHEEGGTIDAQPSNETGGILIMVTGALRIDNESNPLKYAQTFQLMPADGAYYVQNEMFKLL